MSRAPLPRFANLRSQEDLDREDRRARAAALTSRVVNAAVLLASFALLAYLGATFLQALPALLPLGDLLK